MEEIYSRKIAFIFIFNLIVGTGALAMPFSFNNAGWLLSLFVLIILAFFSLFTASLFIEAMSLFNYIHINVRKKKHDDHPVSQDDHFIQKKIEFSDMAKTSLSTLGNCLYYLTIILYLYGDLAIYAAVIPKTLRDVSCTYYPETNISHKYRNQTKLPDGCNAKTKELEETLPCWLVSDKNSFTSYMTSFNRWHVYRLYVIVLILLLFPFCCMNLSKTKYLQITTLLTRWIGFLLMITIAIYNLKGKSHDKPKSTISHKQFNLDQLPTLIGTIIYSFMCHHSLPSIITPIPSYEQHKIFRMLLLDYVLIASFYALLSYTAIFSFSHIFDVYTLNFRPNFCSIADSNISMNNFPYIIPIGYFIALFPVFTLSTTFPIIAITLRNNLRTLFSTILTQKSSRNNRVSGGPGSPSHNVNEGFTSSNADLTTSLLTTTSDEDELLIKRFDSFTKPSFKEQFYFAILTVVPPFIIVFLTSNISSLIGITGSYAGVIIQYVWPVVFLKRARSIVSETNADAEKTSGGLQSFFTKSLFKHEFKSYPFWFLLPLVWAVICIIIVTISHISSFF